MRTKECDPEIMELVRRFSPAERVAWVQLHGPIPVGERRLFRQALREHRRREEDGRWAGGLERYASA